MPFNFATVGRIRFGDGTASEVGGMAAQLASKLLIVCGKSTSRIAWLTESIDAQGLEHLTFKVSGEPDIDLIRQGVALARAEGCNGVISCGGGSAIDAAKATAILVSNGGDPLDYLEVIGQGKALTKPSLPHIAVPTTAGTGAEVTKNAVLLARAERVKVSLRSEAMLPSIAVIDPLLTHTLPPAVTASTGLDALTQCIEPYVSSQANPLTDLMALEGIRRAAAALPIAFANGADAAARTDMAFASLLGGLALANAKLGAVHGFAGVIGGMFPAPHGNICARLLPYVFEQNVAALSQRDSAGPILARHRKVAAILTGDERAEIADGVAWLHDLCARLKVPALGNYGVGPESASDIVAASARSSSMQGNPIPLTSAELHAILAQAIG